MTWPALIMLAVVVISATLAWWNVTLAALVASWTLAQAYWLITGDNTPVRLYVILDGCVLGVIFAKCAINARQYTGWLRYCSGFLNKSWGDKVVILVFPAAWVLYALPESQTQWIALWALAIVQFVAAGGDSVAYLISRGQARSDRPPPGMYRMVWARAGGG